MFDTFGNFELRALYAIQDLVKQDCTYYRVIGDVIKEIEKPKTYSVSLKIKDGRLVTHRGISKVYVRDTYIYLKNGSLTLSYNMNELIFYQVIEIEQEVKNDV